MKNQGSGEGKMFLIFAVLHVFCCGIPLLLLSGVSLAFLAPAWPVIGVVVAVIGVIGFMWYLKRGCSTCQSNEGGCNGNCKIREVKNSQAVTKEEVNS